MIKEKNDVVRATVTYNPSMVASGVALAVTGVRGEKLGNTYHGVPSRIILGAELVEAGNADSFYFPDSAY
jgi:ribose transport system substrate-binding protein